MYHNNMSKIQFCTICLYWDILASVKAFFTQHWGFWLVTMVTGHHFEFFYDIFKTVKMYTLYLDTSCWLESPFKIRGIVHHLFLLSFLWSILFNRFTFELYVMSINTITEKTQKTFWYYLASLIMNSTKIVFTGVIITLDM